MRIFLIIFTALISLKAQATITISSVSGASNEVDLTPDSEDSSSVIEIMAGLSGGSGCTSSTGTVNTCVLLKNRGACNFKTVCDNTELRITLKSDNTSGKIVLVNSENEPITFSSTSSYTSGQTYTAVIPWSAICEEIVGDPGCGRDNASVEVGKSETLKIGVDSNNDDTPDDALNIKVGIYGIENHPTFQDSGENRSVADDLGYGVGDYYLFPGDNKATIEEFSSFSGNTLTAPGAARISSLRGFFSQGSCADANADPFYVNNGSDSYLVSLDKDLKNIENNRIEEGLSNGNQYVFMFGLQDEAGNIGAFKDITLQCDDIASGTTTYNRHSVIPQPVFGLLQDNQNCYVSTAAYGTPLHDKVKTFKQFRDLVLKQYSWGRYFIKFYYKTSPPIADAIRQNQFLKMATRALLWPAWAVSAAVLYMGFMPFMFVVTMVLLSFVFLREKKSKKKSSNQTFLIFFLVFAGLTVSEKTFAQDDFFSTESKSSAKESAPNEPPYNGTENDEFSDLENSAQESIQTEEEYEPEIPAPTPKSNFGTVKESPDKWKPYQRVPDEKRLEELSDEGLMKITKKGGYQYKVKPSEQKSAASFRFGMASFPNLQNPTSGTYFTDIYDEDKKPMLMMDYEWQFFQNFGKLGLKVGSGLMLASGQGQFNTAVQTPNGPTTDAKEKYNFYMFPNSIAAIYRLDIFDRQWIVPFAEVGVDYLSFIEVRDDGADFKFGGAPHFHFAVGGSFLLDVLGRDMMAEIDSQYGVNHLWLTAEYRRLESMGGNFDFSDDVINGGIMVEF